jgi:hypothetical protein
MSGININLSQHRKVQMQTTTTRTWVNQFGEEYAVPASITSQFTDISWGNDCAPSFTHKLAHDEGYDGTGFSLWVDHPEKEKREIPEMMRFRIVNDAKEELVLETDDEAQVVAKMLSLGVVVG